MFKQFLLEEDGQTTVEYLLIIAVIVVVISVLGSQLKQKLPEVIAKIFQGVNKQIDKLMGSANN